MKKTHLHYWSRELPSCCLGKAKFGVSCTIPGQGFRPKEVVARMMAGAPPPIGRNPVYIDPSYGVDPTARFDLPIEEMAAIAASARDRVDELIAARDEYLRSHPDSVPADLPSLSAPPPSKSE